MASWKNVSLALIVGLTGCGQLAEGFVDGPYTGEAMGRFGASSATTVNVVVKRGSARQWAERQGLRVLKEIPQLGAVTVTAPSGAQELAARLKQDPAVRFAEADIAVDMPRPLVHRSPLSLFGLQAQAPDPYTKKQYSLDIMQVREAWQVTRGQGVKVAVIDSGFDYGHPELKNQMLAGSNAWHGVDGKLFSGPSGHSHGTHVAGIIAAEANNGLGIAGVAPDAKVFPIRLWADEEYQQVRAALDPSYIELVRKLEAQEKSIMSVLVGAIIKAVEQKCDVINMSLGVNAEQVAKASGSNGGGGDAEMDGLKLYMMAVQYAIEHGVTVMVAAGNERQEGSPANLLALHPGIISVGATDANDEIAPFSNRGQYVAVSAPGVDVLSTVPATMENATFPYENMDGTSMATPNAVGVVALVKSVFPQLPPDAVKKILMATADDRGPQGMDPDFGAGRVNALKAVVVAAKLKQKQPR